MTQRRELLETVVQGRDLTADQARAAMDQIMSGELDEAQIGGFLAALRGKGETPEELAGAASSMRKHAEGLEPSEELRPLVDTCGTGGDSAETFNISTLSALVAAGAGARVAKHGNRSVSSQCGSADLLEALGVRLDLDAEGVETCIEEAGMGFMFAPNFHGAMKHAIGPRKSLGIRTIFNLLGPLTNPADADRQLMGVFSSEWVEPLAQALAELSVERALVVHGTDGMDEISLSAPTRYAELTDGQINTGEFKPGDFGVDPIELEDIAGGSVDHNADLARSLLAGDGSGPAEAIVSVNSGAVVYLSGQADDLKQGVERARDAIRSGTAQQTLEDLVETSEDQRA